MKFLVDKALSPRTVSFLNNHGFQSVRVNEVILKGRVSDREIFEYAIDNDCIIVTADVDFGQLLAYTKLDKPSIILLRVCDS